MIIPACERMNMSVQDRIVASRSTVLRKNPLIEINQSSNQKLKDRWKSMTSKPFSGVCHAYIYYWLQLFQTGGEPDIKKYTKTIAQLETLITEQWWHDFHVDDLSRRQKESKEKLDAHRSRIGGYIQYLEFHKKGASHDWYGIDERIAERQQERLLASFMGKIKPEEQELKRTSSEIAIKTKDIMYGYRSFAEQVYSNCNDIKARLSDVTGAFAISLSRDAVFGGHVVGGHCNESSGKFYFLDPNYCLWCKTNKQDFLDLVEDILRSYSGTYNRYILVSNFGSPTPK